MKMCSRCRALFPSEAFYRTRASTDGLHSWCKKCFNEKQNQYRAKSHAHILSQQAAYRESNRNKQRDKNRAYRSKNRTLLAAKQRKYYALNTSEILPRQAAYRAATIEQKRTGDAAYREANKEKLNAYKKATSAIDREILSDAYVIFSIRRRNPVRITEITQPLIEAKRAHLKLIRLIKEKQK